MSGLSSVDVLRLGSVVEDCADQLAVLGHVMPDKSRGAVEEKLWSSSLAKLHRDWQFVLQVVSSLLLELKEKQSFSSLLEAVEEEEMRKAHLLDVIIREEEGGRRTRVLQRQILNLHQETTQKLQDREELTALLKDQLQEVKVKTSMENQYTRRSAELQLYQTHKLTNQAEKTLEDHIQLLQDKLEEERRVHEETQNFLKKQQMVLREKLEELMERYERAVEEKQQEVNSLRISRASNRDVLQELSRKYREGEQAVMEDRKQKENMRRQLEREQMERSAATTIQAWWRGCLVRRGLGPHQRGQKAKGGKKKGKKKK